MTYETANEWPNHIFRLLFAKQKAKMKVTMVRSLQSALRRASTAGNSQVFRRGYASESATNRKVAILGAAGGIGQPLSLLMKLNPLVSSLSLYDIAATPGVAADVSHINTRSEVPSLSRVLGLRNSINSSYTKHVFQGLLSDLILAYY